MKSLLRKHREEISKSAVVETEAEPAPSEVKPAPVEESKVSVVGGNDGQPAPGLDLLQRRKLLFIESSSSSDSSDWEMSDCLCFLNQQER